MWFPRCCGRRAPERVARAAITDFAAFVGRADRSDLPDYHALWDYSTQDLAGFWSAVADYFEVRWHDAAHRGAAGGRHARRRLVPRRHAELRRARAGRPATGGRRRPGGHRGRRGRHRAAADPGASCARRSAPPRPACAGSGVGPGDRVVALVPNAVHALVGFLATAALGAVWSSCSPDFGAPSVIDRFTQISPTVLIAVDGYRYGGKEFAVADDRAARSGRRCRRLAGAVHIPALGTAAPDGMIGWDELTAEPAEPDFTPVPFSAPLWVLYSSGTTGLPKPIVQSVGGILLEHLKSLRLHWDLGPGRPVPLVHHHRLDDVELPDRRAAGRRDRRAVRRQPRPSGPDDAVAAGRAAPGHAVRDVRAVRRGLPEGGSAPGGRAGSDRDRRHRVDRIAAGRQRFPLDPRRGRRATSRSPRSPAAPTCAPASSAARRPCRCGWARSPAARWVPRSSRTRPTGEPLIDEVGELVITAPMPSMPVFFWGDEDGSRLHESYFADYPGVWRHGDWIRITSRGSCVIEGRSDATLNRGGVRMGTAEFYRVVESVPEVADSLVVDTSVGAGEGDLLLFVVLDRRSGRRRASPARLRSLIRTELSPRHVPGAGGPGARRCRGPSTARSARCR